jgi:hypothetical protein
MNDVLRSTVSRSADCTDPTTQLCMMHACRMREAIRRDKSSRPTFYACQQIFLEFSATKLLVGADANTLAEHPGDSRLPCNRLHRNLAATLAIGLGT